MAKSGIRTVVDTTDTDTTQIAVKGDDGKPRMDLLPSAVLLEAGAVMAKGAEKYGDRNWEKGLDHSRLYGAAQRHLLAYWDGEDNDPETGFSHLAHALCSVMMLRGLTMLRPDLDDRPHVGFQPGEYRG